jgi:hypothetical protein
VLLWIALERGASVPNIDWQQNKNGKDFFGDASDKRSYYAYGKPVLKSSDHVWQTRARELPLGGMLIDFGQPGPFSIGK